MLGSIPSVTFKKLGFEEIKSHVICGIPLYNIYPINETESRQMAPAEIYSIILSAKHFLFLFADMLPSFGADSIALALAVFIYVVICHFPFFFTAKLSMRFISMINANKTKATENNASLCRPDE